MSKYSIVLHLLPTNGASTFDDYATDVFIPYINKQLDAARCVDVVWDSYVKCSNKESTREKRGKGMRKRWQEETNSQATGMTSSMMLQTSKNSSCFSPIVLS